MKKSKGFTLAELLIVVAIIAVLVAVSIPVFTSQLHKAQDATDLANIRSYYAELQSSALADGGIDTNKLTSAFADTITFQNGESVELENLTYKVTKASSGDSYIVTYTCGDNCSAGHTSEETFGGT